MRNLLLIGLLFFTFLLNGQDTLYLSLTKVIDYTASNNLTIKSNEIKYNLAKANLYTTIGQGLPTFGIGINRFELNGYTQSTEGNFLDVEKDNEWNGKSFRISWDISELFFNSVTEKYKVKAAFYDKEIDNLLEKSRVFSLYYYLAASQEKEKAIISFINKNTEIVEQLELQVSAGLRLQSELLLAKSNLNNLKIQLLQQNQLSTKLMQDLLVAINIKDQLFIKPDCNFYGDFNSRIDIKVNNQLALNNSFRLVQLNKEVEAYKWQKNKAFFGMLLPKISIGMNDGLLGPINQDAFGNQNLITSSLIWSIPVANIFPAGNYKTKSNLYKLKMFEKFQLVNDLTAEINTTTSEYRSAIHQYDLAKQSETYAKKAYNQSLKRQDLGTATQLELFHAEKEYLNAKLIYIDAIAYFHKTKFHHNILLTNKVVQ